MLLYLQNCICFDNRFSTAVTPMYINVFKNYILPVFIEYVNLYNVISFLFFIFTTFCISLSTHKSNKISAKEIIIHSSYVMKFICVG